MSAIIKLAVLAVGGQGGGVLSGWITQLAEQNGFVAQMTSVAGVAQRTGATIYYIEMAPTGPRAPVFSLHPAPGEIDVLIAAEIMEAGRAAQRGFITPDRTVLITSTHRILATVEKQVPGDGRGDGGAVLDALRGQARQIVADDLERIAQDAGSVISATLFGALARSRALPFDADAFRAVIAASKKGAQASLRAFDAALDGTTTPSNGQAPAPAPSNPAPAVSGPARLRARWDRLVDRAGALPAPDMVMAGLQKCVDFQDLDYGADYLDRIEPLMGQHPDLDRAAAKYVANALCYDDLPRVADLKTRASRDARLRREQEIPDGGIVHVTEYFHPRPEEVFLTLPARLGGWLMDSPRAHRIFGRVFGKGRRIRTDGLSGFALLWVVGGLRRWRRGSLRHRVETVHVDALIAQARSALQQDAVLAAEILSCQRLIKGYSDTHTRGQSKFARVMAALPLLAGRPDAADWIRRLRTAALADEQGAALDGALMTVRSFAQPAMGDQADVADPATPA